MYILEVLYTFHGGIELLFGSLLFLRGKGAMDKEQGSAQARLYRRWHGAGLLGLSSLGWLVLLKGQVHEATGELASSALSVFHFGCVAAHFMAAVESGNKAKAEDQEVVPMIQAACSPHVPLFFGFLAHAGGLLK
mmetsp:Transcript_13932/g.26018  ORF Transcript_13932/g.26018 Transcript_13932/m.26018 type:complete len:135 (+) Transcript_13932:100-504(+)